MINDQTFRKLRVPEIHTALYYEPKITAWLLWAWMVLPDGEFIRESSEMTDIIKYSEDQTFVLIRKVFDRFMETQKVWVDVRTG